MTWRLRRLAAVCLLAGLAPGAALAWNDTSRIRMADDAVRLAPPALARQLLRHREECRRGAVGEPADERRPAHSPGPDGVGAAAEELDRRVREAVEALERREPMRVVCWHLGRIGHIVADLNLPFRTARPELRSAPLEEDFAGYAEGVFARIPLVFTGWREGLLDLTDVRPVAHDIARISARDGEPLHRAFHPGGRRVPASSFDDRSIPFALASLAYSRAVSDTANMWLLVWSRAGGDLRGTRYLDPGAGGAAGN